jgi:diketogulonate reductase-like aldo/keto reductase
MAVTKTFKLNTGAEMPAFGLGTWQFTDEEGVVGTWKPIHVLIINWIVAERQTAAKTEIQAR